MSCLSIPFLDDYACQDMSRNKKNSKSPWLFWWSSTKCIAPQPTSDGLQSSKTFGWVNCGSTHLRCAHQQMGFPVVNMEVHLWAKMFATFRNKSPLPKPRRDHLIHLCWKEMEVRWIHWEDPGVASLCAPSIRPSLLWKIAKVVPWKSACSHDLGVTGQVLIRAANIVILLAFHLEQIIQVLELSWTSLATDSPL